MWSMCIILIVVVFQKQLSQSLECNTLTNKRFYGNVGNKIRVGCTHNESINYCDIGSYDKSVRRCTMFKNTEQCPSESEIKFVGNINTKTCEFEVEVKTLYDSDWLIGIDQRKFWNFKVFGLHDCFENNMDYSGSDAGYGGAVDSTFDCQKKCQTTTGCQNWAWVTENGKNGNKKDSPKGCFLKGEKNGSSTLENVISGPKNCPVPEFKILNCSENPSGQIHSGNSISFFCKTNQAISQCTFKKSEDDNKKFQSPSTSESRAKFSYSPDNLECIVELTNLEVADSGTWILELKGESAQTVQVRNFQLKVVQGCFETNTQYNANSNEEFQSSSASDCKSACLSRSNCDMWTFTPQGNCMLFGVDNYAGKIQKSGFVSGPAKCHGCYRLGTGMKDNTGQISKEVVTSPKQCQRNCEENKDCKLFNFNTRAKNCFLRSGVTQDKFNENPEAVVGAKYCTDPSAIWETDSTVSSTNQPLLTTATPPSSLASISPSIPPSTLPSTPPTQITTPLTTTPITTAEIIATSTEISLTAGSVDNNEISIGGIVGGLVFVLLVGLIIVFVLHKKKKRRELLRPVSVVPTRTSRVSMAQLESRDDKRRPITVAELTLGVPLKKYPVKNEYNMLVDADSKHNGFRFTNNEGRKYTAAQNGGFNRYGNILPYDHNRVILNSKVNDCDYVNASWIANNSLPLNMPRFIAAQGPFDRTIPHFLQMVVDYDVKAIVMLTKLTESTKGAAGTTIETEKSSKYWPNSDIQDGQTFGHFKVTTQSEHLLHQIENTMVRKLQIEDTLTKKIHGPVTHFHFTAWPDFGVAEHCGTIIDLVQTVRNVVGKYEGSSTVIVHCSAGVGRTGTLIALYKLMEKIDAKVVNETIDIYNEVFQLREDRCCMVQKEEQYKFLYECVASYFSHDSSANDPDYIYTFYNFEDDNIA